MTYFQKAKIRGISMKAKSNKSEILLEFGSIYPNKLPSHAKHTQSTWPRNVFNWIQNIRSYSSSCFISVADIEDTKIAPAKEAPNICTNRKFIIVTLRHSRYLLSDHCNVHRQFRHSHSHVWINAQVYGFDQNICKLIINE